ncbi:hypothetical protein JCM5350_000841 [Sporobolomyces pararoseus]
MEPSAPPHPALRTSISFDFQHHAASVYSKNDYSTSSRSVSDRFSRIPFTTISSSSPLRDRDLFQPPSSSFRFPSTPTNSLQQYSRESPSPTDTIRPIAFRAPSPPGTRSHSSLSVSSRRGPLPPPPPLSTLAPPRTSLSPSIDARSSTSQLRQTYMNPSLEDWGERGLSGESREREDLLFQDDTEQQRTRLVATEGESIPGYDTNEDPFSDERAAGGGGGGGGGEKNRLMEVLRARRGEDVESSRSAEIGSRDHLERWRNEQTNLEAESNGNGREVGGNSSGRTFEGQRDTSKENLSTGMKGSASREGGGSQLVGTSLAGMSDAEIAQHHFRLAQQHLEAAQRLAMAASQNPAPSAPPSSSHDHSHATTHYSSTEEDVFPPSSSSSHTEYPESTFGDSVEFHISSRIRPQYPSTYSQVEPYPLRHESSREGLYSEFGRLNLEGTKPLFDGKRSRSLSNSNPPLSSVSEKAPPLPIASISLTDSKTAPNHSKFSSLPSSKSPAQQYPARMTSNSSLQSPVRRRPSTADQLTPRAAPRQTNRRPSTAEHTRPSPPPPQGPLPSLPASDLAPGERPTVVPSLYGGTLPQGMQDRIGTVPHPPPSTYSSTSSSSRSNYLESQQSRQRQQQVEDAFEYESILEGGGNSDGSYQELDGFDSASDYHDVQSTISHVTNATLPPYEYERRFSQISASLPPPVPSIPPAFRSRDQAQYSSSSICSHGSISSGATLINSVDQHYRNTGSNEGDEFHGFRPRLGTGYSQPQGFTSSTPYPITESAQWVPSRQDQGRVQAQSDQIRLFAPDPALSTAQIQPHSYILGADGRPIPVYTSLPSSAPLPLPQQQTYSTTIPTRQPSSSSSYSHSAPLPAANRQPLPIHSQPLQFDHSLHINPSRQPATLQRPTLSIPSSHPSIPSVSPSSFGSTLSSHAYHLPPPSTFTQPQPRVQIRSTSTTPSSTSHSSEHSSIAATTSSPTSSSSSSSEIQLPPSSSSIMMPFMKRNHNRLVSSGMSLRRMVRSPHVRFKSPEPSIAETSSHTSKDNKTSKLGGGGGRGEGDGSSKDERNQKAMQQSLGMLM